MKFLNQVRLYGARVAALATAPAALLVAGLVRAADESGITTTEAVAVVADGKIKGMIIALAVFGLVIAFKIVKKVTSAV